METPKAQRHLDYFRGISQMSAVPARLTWTADDRLRLEVVDQAGEPTEVVFDAPVTEVTIGGGFTTPSFTVAGGKHRVDFAFRARVQLAVGAFGGAAGLEVVQAGSVVGALGTAADSGVAQWASALRVAGARSRYWSSGRITAVTLASVAGLTIILFVGIVIASVVNAAGSLVP